MTQQKASLNCSICNSPLNHNFLVGCNNCSRIPIFMEFCSSACARKHKNETGHEIGGSKLPPEGPNDKKPWKDFYGT